jgi:hypothetical protein
LVSSPDFFPSENPNDGSKRCRQRNAPPGVLRTFFHEETNSDGERKSVHCAVHNCDWSVERSGISTTSLWRHLATHADALSHEQALRYFCCDLWFSACSSGCSTTRYGGKEHCHALPFVLLEYRSAKLLTVMLFSIRVFFCIRLSAVQPQ